MALEPKPLKIRPGLVTVETDRGAEGYWKDGNRIRFWNGLPQKIGGWAKNGTATFLGKARGVIDWLTLSSERFIAIGTHLKLYVWKGGVFSDITPIRETQSPLPNNPFATTNASAVVTVTDTAHGATDGDYVTFSGAAAVAGITISGEYALTYVDANTYTITHSAAANATTTGGGAAVVGAYQISVGASQSTPGLGYGAGAYGASTYGTARSVSSILNAARTWSLDHWGEDLIANPRGGGIYVWDASTGVGTRATLISGAPTTAKSVFVSEEDRHLVALGAHDGSANDPLLVRWSDTEDYTDWTATEENTAGDKRLDGGNELMCAVKMTGGRLIHSDTEAWFMTFDGPPYTYGFLSKGKNGHIRSPNAAVAIDDRAYWMGKNNFHIYDGSVRVLPCPVHNHVFEDINDSQSTMVFAGVNLTYQEVWWLYPSANATECDRYVLFNTKEGTWSFGELARTAFVGNSKVFTNAYALGTDGYLYDHETGVSDDGQAMGDYLESGDFDIGDGAQLMHIGGAVPDFKILTGSVSATFKGRRYPQDAEQQQTTAETITSSTKRISPRMRCRQIALRIESNVAGDNWRMGTWNLELRPHGKK